MSSTLPIAHKEAYALWSRLEAEFERFHAAISFIPIDQMRLQDDLRRYLCLRCAGFLEKLVFDCVDRYLRSISGGPALHFAQSFFSKAPNLNAETLTRLVGRFGPDHSIRFEDFMTKKRIETLNDLAALRNPIAHGDVAGGRKLDPEIYRRLCSDLYVWFTGDLLTPPGTTVAVDNSTESVSIVVLNDTQQTQPTRIAK